MRFKSSKGNFTHIYTYIKLEQNFYLVKKNKKKKERRIIENIKHRNPTWLLFYSLFIIFFGLEIYLKSTPTPSPSPPGDCYSIGSSQLPQALWLRGTIFRLTGRYHCLSLSVRKLKIVMSLIGILSFFLVGGKMH